MVTAAEIYGVDLRLTNKDFVVSGSGGFSPTSGNENLLQAISNRLTTEMGSLAYNNQYGVDLTILIGEKNTPIKRQLVKSIVIKALKAESRISTINKLDLTQDTTRQDILYIDIEVTPIESNETVTLNLVYPFYLNQSNLRVANEAATSTSAFSITVEYEIYSVKGVYLATDTTKSGKNYFVESTESGVFSGKTVTVINELPSTTASVIVDYNRRTADTEQGG